MGGHELLCDTGPLVAFLNRRDRHHEWTKRQFGRIFEPLKTCEAVISEAVFLLQDDGLSADPIFEAIARGKLRIEFTASTYWPDLRRLMLKYHNLPMSFADACLVRMAELSRRCQVFTTDHHFRIYRRHGRHVIAVLAPF